MIVKGTIDRGYCMKSIDYCRKKAKEGHKKTKQKMRNELITRSRKRIEVDDAMKSIERIL